MVNSSLPLAKKTSTNNVALGFPDTRATPRHPYFRNVPDSSWKDWKWQFRNRITSLEQLAKLIPLSTEEQPQISSVVQHYPLSITPYYLSLINPDDPADPIRKQAVPCIEEISMSYLGLEDPLAEEIIAGRFKDGSRVEAVKKGETLVFK